MAATLFHLAGDIRDQATPQKMQPIHVARPRECSCCGAWSPIDGPHVLVGHGTYKRRVRLQGGEVAIVRVQRFLCTLCKKTTSVLPSDVAPRRRFGATVILEALIQHLLRKESTGRVRERFTESEQPLKGWKTLARWRKTILVDLWPSFAAQIGFVGAKETSCRSELRERLARLLGLHSAHANSSPLQLHRVACMLTAGAGLCETASASPERTALREEDSGAFTPQHLERAPHTECPQWPSRRREGTQAPSQPTTDRDGTGSGGPLKRLAVASSMGLPGTPDASTRRGRSLAEGCLQPP